MTLYDIIRQKSFTEGKFKLSAGGASSYFFNLKPTMLDALGANLIGDAVLQRVQEYPVTAIGGLAIGAVPIVAVTVAKSLTTPQPLTGFYVRKEIKDHGTQQLIEGLDVRGLSVILVEDVTTTGASLWQAAQTVRAHGGMVTHAIAVVDRLEGGQAYLAKRQITLLSIFTRDDFI